MQKKHSHYAESKVKTHTIRNTALFIMKTVLAILLTLLPMMALSQSDADYDNWIFEGDLDITEYTIPDGVKVIGYNAFFECEQLASITIPESVEVIEESAFESCKSLKYVFIPKNVKEIKDCAFGSCYQLQRFDVDKDNKFFSTIDGVLFNFDKTKLVCSPNLKKYVIPNGTKTIGAFAFQGCNALETIILPNSVNEIEDYAFSICDNLTSITIPETVKDIGEYVFWRTENINIQQSEMSDYAVGCMLYDQEKYEEAIKYFQKTNALDKTQNKKSSPQYYRSELKMAYCNRKLSTHHYRSSDYREVIRLLTQTAEIFRKVLGKKNPYYVISVSDLATCYAKIGNYTKARRLGAQALKLESKFFSPNSPEYEFTMRNLAEYNAQTGHYNKAIKLGSQVLEIRRKNFGEKHSFYIEALKELEIYKSQKTKNCDYKYRHL